MAKYIDTDKIKDNAVFPYLGGDKEKQKIYREGFYRAMQCVERAEVEDVRPERHGKWLYKVVESEDVWTAWDECSLCGEQGEDDYHYCPNCGAKMDGKGDGNG